MSSIHTLVESYKLMLLAFQSAVAAHAKEDTYATRAALRVAQAALHTPVDHRDWFFMNYAEYLLLIEEATEKRNRITTKLAAALEENKKSAWKWANRAAKESSNVLALRKELIDHDVHSLTIDARYKITLETVARYKTWELEEVAFKAWLAGGETPLHVRRQQEAEMNAFLEEADVIDLSSREYPNLIASARSQTVPMEEWTPMTVDQYLGLTS